MRTHRDIIRSFGATRLWRALAGRGRPVGRSTPQAWADRNSAPARYWTDLVEIGAAASLDELAHGAEARTAPLSNPHTETAP